MVVGAATTALASDLGEILEVSTTSLDDGLTVVTIHTDSVVETRHWTSTRLSDPARAIFRLKAFGPALPAMKIEVGDGVIHRLRLGFHPEFNPPEVHLVMDLESKDVEIARIRASGKNLLIYVVRPERPKDTEAEVVLMPTPTPPPVQSPPPAEDWPPPKPPVPTSPAPQPQAAFFQAKLLEIVTTPRGDETTSIRITTDRPLSSGTFGSYRVGEEPPRHVISLIGVDGNDLQPVIPKEDPNIAGIRMELKEGAAGGQIHLILDLKQSSVEVTRLVQNGAHLVLLLEKVI